MTAQEARVDHISTGGRWVILSDRPIDQQTAALIREQWAEWRADPESRPAVLPEMHLVDLKTGREYPTPEGELFEATLEAGIPVSLPAILAIAFLGAALGILAGLLIGAALGLVP